MNTHRTALSLLADVGGTNTRVTLSSDGLIIHETMKKFRNAEFDGLGQVLCQYLSEQSAQPDNAAVAVAGPVRDGRGELTNLAWKFGERDLATETEIQRVHILNDLQAQGFAIETLDEAAVKLVVPGTGNPRKGQSQLVVGVGTGFNAAPIHFGPEGRLVLPSECGHILLPQAHDIQRDAARWLESQFGFASVEDALSGRGFENLYRYFTNEPAGSAKSYEILGRLENKSDEYAKETVGLFVQFLATTLGDLALTHLPFGGIYLIGGMARAVTPHFQTFDFKPSFRSKGRFASLLEEFSVFVVEDDFAALAGCASFLSEQDPA